MAVRFCPLCATALDERLVFGRPRLACPACDYVHFEEPKLAVGVVATRDGAILMTRRAHEPKLGAWSFPSGFVDAFEDPSVAAARETWEETGLRITVRALLGVYRERESRVVFVAYAAEAAPGALVPNNECLDLRFFPANRLPPPAFAHDAAIVQAWRRYQATPDRFWADAASTPQP